MKKTRTILYVNVSLARNEVLFSGIKFAEFLELLSNPITNIMIINIDNSLMPSKINHERGLELFEGCDEVKKLSKESTKNIGNFCFVDYDYPKKTNALTEENISELLYLGHMFKPLNSPFFEVLNNQFAYLTHDDGWYGKLYCRDIHEFISVFCRKIITHISNKNISEIPITIKEKLTQIATNGLLIDMDEVCYKNKIAIIPIYVIGEHLDMDKVQNNLRKIKESSFKHCNLHYDGKDFKIL